MIVCYICMSIRDITLFLKVDGSCLNLRISDQFYRRSFFSKSLDITSISFRNDTALFVYIILHRISCQSVLEPSNITHKYLCHMTLYLIKMYNVLL